MPSREEILQAFERLSVWSRGPVRAPHKPLLVLYALGQLARGEGNSAAFRERAPKLTELLREFGPSRKSHHPEYPFWRLQNDGVWVIENAEGLRRRAGQTDIPKRELLENDIHAHFTEEIAAHLASDPALVSDVALRPALANSDIAFRIQIQAGWMSNAKCSDRRHNRTRFRKRNRRIGRPMRPNVRIFAPPVGRSDASDACFDQNFLSRLVCASPSIGKPLFGPATAAD